MRIDYKGRENDKNRRKVALKISHGRWGKTTPKDLLAPSPSARQAFFETFDTNGRLKWEVYCWVSLSLRLSSQEGTAIQMGDVLQYKLEMYGRVRSPVCSPPYVYQPIFNETPSQCSPLSASFNFMADGSATASNTVCLQKLQQILCQQKISSSDFFSLFICWGGCLSFFKPRMQGNAKY